MLGVEPDEGRYKKNGASPWLTYMNLEERSGMKYESPRVDFRSGSTAEPGRPWRGDHQRVYMHPVALSRRFCPTVSKSPGVSSNPIRPSPSTAPSPFFRTCRSSVCPASPLENLPCSPGSSIMGASVSERVAAVIRQEEEVLPYILLKRGEPSCSTCQVLDDSSDYLSGLSSHSLIPPCVQRHGRFQVQVGQVSERHF